MMLHEKLISARANNRSSQWFMENEKYGSVIDTMVKRSSLSKYKKIDEFDKVVLGQQLLMFENFVGFVNEVKGSSAELGKVPEVGLDVIGGIYGESILPLIGTTFNMPEKVGIYWYKQTKAATTRGNLTDGQVIRDPRQASNAYAAGYASGKQDKVQLTTTSVGVTNYNLVLYGAPVQPRSVVISIPDMGIYEGIDNGQGKYYGDSTQATINYTNGVANLKLTVTPTGAHPIYVSWITDWETENIIPKIQTGYSHMTITTEPIALQGETSIYKDFDMSNRFGEFATQDMVTTLIRELTSELNYRGINAIKANTTGAVTVWDPVPNSGQVPYSQHAPEFMAVLDNMDVEMLNRLGRGRITRIIAGASVCAVCAHQSKFVPSNIDADGPHVFGTLGNRIIIRDPSMNPLEAIMMFHGTSVFDAPLVSCTYQPLYVDGVIPSPDSPIVKVGLVTTQMAFATPIQNFSLKFRLKQAPASQYTI